MNMYQNPNFCITRFEPSDIVATCDSTSYYKSITVSCVIEGSHEIFNDSSYCESLYSSMCIVKDSDGCEYLVWLESGDALSGTYTYSGSLDNLSGFYLIQELSKAIGIKVTGNSLHAGKITPELESYINISQ